MIKWCQPQRASDVPNCDDYEVTSYTNGTGVCGYGGLMHTFAKALAQMRFAIRTVMPDLMTRMGYWWPVWGLLGAAFLIVSVRRKIARQMAARVTIIRCPTARMLRGSVRSLGRNCNSTCDKFSNAGYDDVPSNYTGISNPTIIGLCTTGDYRDCACALTCPLFMYSAVTPVTRV